MFHAIFRKWARKFSLAGRGLVYGVEDQISFYVHFSVAALVLIVAKILHASLWQWCVLILSIGMVLTAELANSAIEELAAGLCREHNAKVGRALDISAGVVLLASITASCIGLLVFYSLFFAKTNPIIP